MGIMKLMSLSVLILINGTQRQSIWCVATLQRRIFNLKTKQDEKHSIQ